MAIVAPVTALTMIALLPIYIGLAFRVIKKRREFKVPVGTGNQSELETAIRVHGNFSEYVPFFLLLLLVAEINQAPIWLLTLGALMMIAGRLIHAIAIPAGDIPKRIIGMQLTFIAMVTAAITNLVPFVLALF
ncbi:MAPEG family protein [Methylicorpusculum oleiharenae]|uniref:MAPEG family protein n=1 Tax=Methylicorpusculum oleiharenae TaxID=1338687 RepID=UPI00135729DA|nr:MAPEG family protein [Methylicorpusculum oleiharenae]MCD2451147.1 MAPEG family protein [Methylicorpusculum oleiharenae]